MEIIKSTGEKEVFNKNKLCNSIKKTGAPKKIVETVCLLVEKKIVPGMTTNQIFRTALSYLIKEDIGSAAVYKLKRGVAELGPAGFIFEQYLETFLQAYGYQTKRDVIVKGQCISHEIDILARKQNNHYLVEAKYHNNPGIKTHVDVIMYSSARLIDITEWQEKREKQKNNHLAWIITNTKFTSSAIKYGKCKGIKLTGWSYPENESLEILLLRKKLFPITVLPSITRFAREQFASKKMILAQDLLPYSVEDLSKEFELSLTTAQKILKEVNELMI